MEDATHEEKERCPLKVTDDQELAPPVGMDTEEVPGTSGRSCRFCGWLSRLRRLAFRRKVTKTVGLCLATLSLGLEFGVRGPTFLDLQLITHTSVQQASAYFTAVHVGYIVGSLVGGAVYDFLSKSLALVAGVLAMGVLVALTPFCAQFGLMVTVCLFAALSAGVVDTASNAEVIAIWGLQGGVAMQAVHFHYALGGIIAPLICEPFLTSQEDPTNSSGSSFLAELNPAASSPGVSPIYFASFGQSRDNASKTTHVQVTSTELWTGVFPMNGSTSSLEEPPPIRVKYAFIIIGIIITLTSLPLVWDYVLVPFLEDGKQGCRRARKVTTSESPTGHAQGRELPVAVYVAVLAWFCVFTLTHSTVEDTFISYLAASVVQQLHWSKQDGALLTSAFWICFAAARVVNIFLLRVVSVAQLLTLSSVLLTLSLLGFLLASFLAVNLGVWASTMLTGAAAAALVPASFAWLEEELVPVTGLTMSFAVLSTSLGSIVNTLVLGYLMEHYGAMWLSYLMLGEMLVSACSFIFLLLFSRLYINRRYGTRQQRKERLLLIAVPNLETEESKVELLDSKRSV